MREQRVLGGEILQREVGGVAVMRMQHDIVRFVARLAGHQEIVDREPATVLLSTDGPPSASDLATALESDSYQQVEP